MTPEKLSINITALFWVLSCGLWALALREIGLSKVPRWVKWFVFVNVFSFFLVECIGIVKTIEGQLQ